MPHARITSSTVYTVHPCDSILGSLDYGLDLIIICEMDPKRPV